MAEVLQVPEKFQQCQAPTSQGRSLVSNFVWRVVTISMLCTTPASAQEATLAEIVAAWEEKQASIESLRLEWEEIAMEKKGSHYSPESAKGMGLPERMTKEYYPPEDWEWRENPTLLLKGAMMRYEVAKREYDAESRSFRYAQFLSSYDGSRSRTLRRVGAKAFGQEEDVEETIAGLDAWKKPLLLAIHPIPKSLDVRNLSIESRHVLVRDVPCIAIRETMRGPGNYYLLFVDPAQGYSIVKATSMQLAGPRFQMEVFYKPIDGIWLPTAWEMGAFTHGTSEIGRMRTATVTRCDLNIPLTQADFRLEFLPGTKVLRNPMVGPDYVVPGRSPASWIFWLIICAGVTLLFILYQWRKSKAFV